MHLTFEEFLKKVLSDDKKAIQVYDIKTLEDNPNLKMPPELFNFGDGDPLPETRNKAYGLHTNMVSLDDFRSKYMGKPVKQCKINYGSHAVCMFCNATLDHGEECDCLEVKRRKLHVTSKEEL